MTEIKKKVKTFASEHKEDLAVVGFVAAYIGIIVLSNNGYKKGYKVGYEQGCNDSVKAVGAMLDDLRLLEKHGLLSSDK